MNAPRRKIYFASDLHLGNRYMTDAAGAEVKLLRWMDRIKRDAAAVYFLGDIFDYWYEYKYVVPRGHVRFLGKLAELSGMGIEIHLLTGNHDIWMSGYLPAETGAIVHHKPFTVELLGKTFFLAHGDEVGYRPLSYRILQRIFRNRICRFLYASVHPRWTFGFARRWSLSSRRSDRAAGKSPSDRARHLETFAQSHLLTHPGIDFFLFGHLHLLLDKKLHPARARLLITGDWMQHFSYVEWDGDRLELKTF